MDKVLYIGDTGLRSAAGYLAGVMQYQRIEFDYIPSDEKFDGGLLKNGYKAVIVSDYPSANFTAEQISAVMDKVRNGMGFLMLGGWESFTGIGGGYNNTEFKNILPVEMNADDDRFNSAKACVMQKECEHEILGNLPFEAYAPFISGFNAFRAKKDSLTLLSTVVFNACSKEGRIDFDKQQVFPLLVVCGYGKARTAAYAGDAAPHWVGGFVDWGDKRVNIKADGGEALEVGNWYIKFFAGLISWVAKL